MEDEEAARDPKAITTQPHLSECDIEDHRACTVYIGYYVPGYRKKTSHRRYSRYHHRLNSGNNLESESDITKSATPPSERVHFILGEEEDGTHEPHPLFSEMEELFQKGSEIEWRETARWIKFEEDVEEGGNRWSKPHVATVSLHSLFELRSCILNGSIILDLEANNLDGIADLILENLESEQQISSDVKQNIKQILLRPHRHLHEFRNDGNDKNSRISLMRSWTDGGRSSSKISSHIDTASASTGMLCDTITNSLSCRALSLAKSSSPEESSSENGLYKLNQPFMRKIPPKAEASNLLIGEVDCLEKTVSSFVRLNESCHLGDLTEVPVPTRFLFVLLGPTGGGLKYHEIGRAMATLLSDEVFHGVAYKAKNRSDLLAGVDEFLDATTVLPPGVWDPRTRIEPPLQTASQESRKVPEPKKENGLETSNENLIICEGQDASCNGKLFEGLMADIRCKIPWYLSDFKDCCDLQCLSSIVFLYFVCIAQIILFGGALAQATKQNIAATECLFSALICGVVYSLCSGQPLILLGITGPVLAFESIVFDICENYSINYLSLRVWIGLWTSAYFLVFVALNLASLVRYITRFTGEIFVTLISAFFIYKAFKNILQIGKKYPIITSSTPYDPSCVCILQSPVNHPIFNDSQCQILNGKSAPVGCSYTPQMYIPNIFLMSVILFCGTFTIIFLLRKLKHTPFFLTKIRTGISDFAVIIAVIIMTITDIIVGLPTPKLEVPHSFKPTLPGRDWLVPFFNENPWWTAIVAILPAMLLTVLLFMDQQITTVIVNRKEHKLKKGRGYHLDLFIVAILIAICSVLGLPWFVAATVLSITHVNSLKRVSHCPTPGEKPHFLGVREQRVTHLCVFVLVGLSVFLTGVLQLIPMPVLYGVFLFMGVTSLKGLQFVERIFLMLMPEKYQPDYSYLRHVPLKQVRAYTLFQVILCALLFCCKLFKPTAFAFPFLLMGVIFSRKGLAYVFNKRYIKLLDDVIPERTKFKKNNTTDQCDKTNMQSESSEETIKSRQNSHANINISEVLMQSSIWKCIDQQSHKTTKKILAVKCKKKKRSKRGSSKAEDCKRLSVMEEEEDEENTNTTDTPSSPTAPKVLSDPSKNAA